MNKSAHQQVFDEVWRHFVVDKNPLSHAGNHCLYRGPDGAKCAIGLFIPDDKYKPEYDKPVSETCGYDRVIEIINEVEVELLLQCDRGFVRNLQKSHDTAATRSSRTIPTELTNLAYVYALDLPKA